MRKLFLILTIILFISCKERNPDNINMNRSTSVMELRQLVNSKETKTNTNGSFFLVFGSINSSTDTNYSIKVFAKVDNYFRVIDIPMEKLRINIDNTLEKPNLTVNYYDSKLSDSKVVDNQWLIHSFVISCPEKYLPEKLLPINL